LPDTAFSTAGISTRSRTGKPPSAMIMRASPSTVAAPPMSFFISAIEAARFEVEPAGVETHALAGQRQRGIVPAIPPDA
jgi:hypothetical protein